MVPSGFIFLDALPLNPNGKVDRLALTKPNYQDLKTDQPFVDPQDELEVQLVNIWEKLLGIQPISMQDDFFELGGHSLLAVRLFVEVEKVFGKNLPLATLFQASTVKDLANIIRQQNWLAPWSSLVPMQPNGSKPPLFYMHAGGGNLLIYRELAYSLGSDQPVYGLQPKGLDGKFDPFRTIEDMADYYVAQILKVQPEGPYFLAGLSSGGNTALEIAQRLIASGQKVALLAMFDTAGPDYYKPLPLVPRLISVLSWFIADWFRRISSWPQKIIRSISQDGWSKTYRFILVRGGLVQANLDADAEIQILRTRTVVEADIKEYQAQAENWLEKLVNTLLIFLLRNSSATHYAGIFARGLTRRDWIYEGTDVLPESLYQVQEATLAATVSYIPKPYRGPITYFRASESPPGIRPAPKGGWDNIAIGGLEIFTIPGNHTSIMESPILAEKLKACLERAQTDSANGYK
jgi:thioesterase domain-containing protein/acyl carrier protein